MTRSERARWTDLQVLAFIDAWVWDGPRVLGKDDEWTDRLTRAEIAAGLGVAESTVAHSLRRLRRDGPTGAVSYTGIVGYRLTARGGIRLVRDGRLIGYRFPATWHCNTEAA